MGYGPGEKWDPEELIDFQESLPQFPSMFYPDTKEVK